MDKTETKSVPNDDDPEAKYRIFSIFSYFVVLVVIGLPVWWYTTRVYRAPLPLSEISDYDIDLHSSGTQDKPYGIPLSLEYDLLITIVNPDPKNLKIDLSGELIEENLKPFLQKINPIANFVVKSQWLHLVELEVIPKKINGQNAIEESQLPHVITPLEKKIWSHLSPRPCLNFVIYVPQCGAPLYIYKKDGSQSESNAFLSPRWGGIYIMNPDSNSCSKKHFQPDLAKIVSVFKHQLQELLDMDLSISENNRVQNLMQTRTLDLINSSKRTLKSLAQLLAEINSIVIGDEIAERINTAVYNIRKASEFIAKNDIKNALQFAKKAFENSETAFSDSSLLALLYFPDDQKYAVYIPLFLPVMIPVLMSLTAVKKWYSQKKSSNTTTVTAKHEDKLKNE